MKPSCEWTGGQYPVCDGCGECEEGCYRCGYHKNSCMCDKEAHDDSV